MLADVDLHFIEQKNQYCNCHRKVNHCINFKFIVIVIFFNSLNGSKHINKFVLWAQSISQKSLHSAKIYIEKLEHTHKFLKNGWKFCHLDSIHWIDKNESLEFQTFGTNFKQQTTYFVAHSLFSHRKQFEQRNWTEIEHAPLNVNPIWTNQKSGRENEMIVAIFENGFYVVFSLHAANCR